MSHVDVCEACDSSVMHEDKFCTSCGHELSQRLMDRNSLVAVLEGKAGTNLEVDSQLEVDSGNLSVSGAIRPADKPAKPLPSKAHQAEAGPKRSIGKMFLIACVSFLALVVFIAVVGSQVGPKNEPVTVQAPPAARPSATVGASVKQPVELPHLPASAESSPIAPATIVTPAASASAVDPASSSAASTTTTDAPPAAFPPLRASPSFDCTKANAGVEKLICSHEDLAQADLNLSLAYKAAMLRETDTSRLRQDQLDWLRLRNSCVDVDCIRRNYIDRETALTKAAR